MNMLFSLVIHILLLLNVQVYHLNSNDPKASTGNEFWQSFNVHEPINKSLRFSEKKILFKNSLLSIKKDTKFFFNFQFFSVLHHPFFRSPLVRDANFLVPEFLAIQYTF